MSDDSTGPESGQVSSRPISANEARLYMRDLSRLTRLLERFLDQAEDTDHEHVVDDSPPLALRCDGAVLLNLGELQGVDLQRFGAELWTGVVVSDTAASDLLDHLADGFQGAAGAIGAEIIKRAKRAQGEEE